ncbi:unnamed protein product, partial [Mycena citricolor]
MRQMHPPRRTWRLPWTSRGHRSCAEVVRSRELSCRVYGTDIEQGGARSGPGPHAADASAPRTRRLPWT